MPLSVFATIKPKPQHLAEARAAIQDIVEVTTLEDGCLCFDLHESAEPGLLYLYEVWADRDAFEAHHAEAYTQQVYKRYENWLAAPVELIFMQPVRSA